MYKSLWIFDYDETLLPNYITAIILNYDTIISKYDLNNILIILLNIITTFNKITVDKNNKIIILTASSNPWVYHSLNKLEKLINFNKKLIDYEILKNNLLKFNYNNIINILNTDNFIKIFIIDLIDNIYYVHDLETKYFNNFFEKTDKYNSLKYIINEYIDYNNILVLGDSYNNEGKHSINISKRINKKIKYIQYMQTDNINLKIEEQHLFYNNINIIRSTNNNVVFEITT